MQPCVEMAARRVHLRTGRARSNGPGDVMHDVVLFLQHLDHFTVTDQAQVARLTAALRVKRGRLHGNGKSVLVGDATDHVNVCSQCVIGKKEALGHYGVLVGVFF